jgi:ribosome-binding factor A
MLNKMVFTINKRLQDREPQFRSEVVRNMDFKKVPRIFFHEKKRSNFKLELSADERSLMDDDEDDDDDEGGT